MPYGCRLFKLEPGLLEDTPEDYGQTAVYRGTIAGHEASYALDRGCVLETGRAVRVSGNTAAILGTSWLAPHFAVVGDRSKHLGRFDLVGPALSDVFKETPGAGGQSCCS